MSFAPDDAFETVYDNVEQVNLIRVDDNGVETVYGPIKAVRDNELHELREVGEQRLWVVSMSWHLKASPDGTDDQSVEFVLQESNGDPPFSVEHGDLIETAFSDLEDERWLVESAGRECLGTEWVARTFRRRPGGGY